MSYPTFHSTRGGGAPVSFGEALLAGLAPDGGLFVPSEVPLLPEGWRAAPDFPALAGRLLSPWLGGELEDAALARLTADAFSFPVPLVPLAGSEWDGVFVLELFHGPTLSFKDFGARAMARLTSAALRRRGGRLTVLVATSGDTGSAVADGFAGQERIDVVLLYPQGQVSDVQERQLIVRRPGVRTFGVEGTFDDCQRMVKAAFADPSLRDVPLSSANSINVGRLVPQSLYYAEAVRQGGWEEVVFCTPSGNLGNLTGGVLAARGGLPVRRFLAAHNANDFFPRHLASMVEDFSPSVRTLSNAMDVGAPSNFERLRALLTPAELRARIWGTSVTDEATIDTIRQVHADTGYLADPHTAVGLEAVRRYRTATGDPGPFVVLATAHPAKFPAVVARAVGEAPPMPDRLAALWDEPTRVAPLAPTTEALREVLLP